MAIAPNLTKSEVVCLLAQELADRTLGFFEKKGPGIGDRATAAFVMALRKLSKETLGIDYSEKAVCSTTNSRFDYYFPDEGVVIEFAFGLRNPNSEFERDILKCLLAIDDGQTVKKLILMGKPGSKDRLKAPAPKAIITLAKKQFDISIEVLELQINPRD